MVETSEHEDQTVLAELLRGYTFKGRLLRASMVKVAVHG
jgi:molecular chaperone GrpE